VVHDQEGGDEVTALFRWVRAVAWCYLLGYVFGVYIQANTADLLAALEFTASGAPARSRSAMEVHLAFDAQRSVLVVVSRWETSSTILARAEVPVVTTPSVALHLTSCVVARSRLSMAFTQARRRGRAQVELSMTNVLSIVAGVFRADVPMLDVRCWEHDLGHEQRGFRLLCDTSDTVPWTSTEYLRDALGRALQAQPEGELELRDGLHAWGGRTVQTITACTRAGAWQEQVPGLGPVQHASPTAIAIDTVLATEYIARAELPARARVMGAVYPFGHVSMVQFAANERSGPVFFLAAFRDLRSGPRPSARFDAAWTNTTAPYEVGKGFALTLPTDLVQRLVEAIPATRVRLALPGGDGVVAAELRTDAGEVVHTCRCYQEGMVRTLGASMHANPDTHDPATDVTYYANAPWYWDGNAAELRGVLRSLLGDTTQPVRLHGSTGNEPIALETGTARAILCGYFRGTR
jgi:hypothetical protein